MDATLIDMGYRGEDASRTPANWGHQPPRQSSPGAGQGNAGSWVDGTQQGYGNDDYDDYASGGVGYGYENGDGYGGYPQQEAGRGAEAPYGQRDAYAPQAPYGDPDGYGQPGGYADPAGYDQPGGYAGPADYGYQQPGGPAAGYGQQPGYGQQNYGQPEPGYGTPGGGQPRYPAADDGSGPRGGYPPRHGGGSGAYPGQDAGNDWYGGQPAAASGASFADTGTLRAQRPDHRRVRHRPARGDARSGSRVPALARPAAGPRADAGPRPAARSGPAGRLRPAGGTAQRPAGAVRRLRRLTPATAASRPRTAVGRNPSGDYPTTVRTSGGYPAAGRGPSGDFPTTVRHPSGDYPTTVRGGYGDGYGQDAPYRETGGRGYNDYGDPAVGYDAGPGRDGRGGYDDYAAAGDLYQDPYGDDTERPGAARPVRTAAPRPRRAALPRTAPPGPRAQAVGPGGRRGKRPLGLIALSVVAVVVIGAAAYVFLLKPAAEEHRQRRHAPGRRRSALGPGLRQGVRAVLPHRGPHR